MTNQPLILLAFSNDKDAYLSKIVEEQKAINKALLDAADNNYLEVRDIQHASTEEIFYLINRYHNQVRILHYGGHADGTALQLEKEIGVVQMANVKGIAGLLGTQKNLKLVFLNGCATNGQVKALLEKGVPAVIATSVSINDDKAQKFAGQFYEALSVGSSIREAFLKAKALLESGENAPLIEDLEETRGLALKPHKQQMPWGLYYTKETENTLDWTLPKESFFAMDFGENKPEGKGAAQANSILVNTTLKAIKDSFHVKRLAKEIYRKRKAGDPNRKPTEAEKMDAICESYPAPVSVSLRALFSSALSSKLNVPRLEKLRNAYQQTMNFMSFIMLSDIWDAMVKRQKALNLSEDEQLHLLSFFKLNKQLAPYYNYFLFADALLKIAKRNDINFYIEALNIYPNGWRDLEVFAKANEHFQSMQIQLEEDIPSRLIESFCMDSEKHLTNLLCELHYLVYYKMAVVKKIEVRKFKNMPPLKYNHSLVELDNKGENQGSKDRFQEMEKPTDMQSVLLYKDDLSNNLNLSPFILDKNALTNKDNSLIFFYSHLCEDGFNYNCIVNGQDAMHISNSDYKHIHDQFAKARQLLLNEQALSETTTIIKTEDDISVLLES